MTDDYARAVYPTPEYSELQADTAETPVRTAVNRISMTLDHLDKLTMALGERMAPVLGPGAPSPGDEPGQVKEAPPLRSPLCNDLDRMADRIAKFNDRIQMTLERLEL